MCSFRRRNKVSVWVACSASVASRHVERAIVCVEGQGRRLVMSDTMGLGPLEVEPTQCRSCPGDDRDVRSRLRELGEQRRFGCPRGVTA